MRRYTCVCPSWTADPTDFRFPYDSMARISVLRLPGDRA